MKGLVVGRIVHYVTETGENMPAMVVKVYEGTSMVNLQVFADTFGQNALQWKKRVQYAEEPEPNSWHWIEREE